MTGSLQKTDRSKYWYAVLTIPTENGKTKPKWISTKCTKKTEAKEVLRKLLNEYEEKIAAKQLQQKQASDASTILFTDYLRAWYQTSVEGIMEGTTCDGYLYNLDNHIIPYFEKLGLKLSEVRRSHIQLFIKEKYLNGRRDGKGGLKVNSINKFVANMSCAFEMAINDELLENNPCTHLKYPEDEEYEANYYTLDNLKILLNLIKGTEIECAIYFATLYALRRGEIIGLKWSAINFDDNIVKICNNRVRCKTSIEKKPKSKASKADMPLISFMKDYLLELKVKQENHKRLYGSRYQRNDYICKHEDGRPFEHKYVNYKLQKIIEANGLPKVTLHGLRHSTATMLASLGYSDLEVQAWLRHGDLASTKRYTHDGIERRINASIGVMGALIEA